MFVVKTGDCSSLKKCVALSFVVADLRVRTCVAPRQAGIWRGACTWGINLAEKLGRLASGGRLSRSSACQTGYELSSRSRAPAGGHLEEARALEFAVQELGVLCVGPCRRGRQVTSSQVDWELSDMLRALREVSTSAGPPETKNYQISEPLDPDP